MNPYDRLSEEELSSAARAGEIAAFEELVQRTGIELFRVSYALTRESTRVERLLQDTVSAVWYECRKRRQKEQKETNVALLLMQSLVIRAKKKRDAGRRDISSPGITPEEGTSAESWQVKQMTSHRSVQVEQAIASMPMEARQVFLLTHLADKETSEIALYIRKSEEVANQRLQKAMTILANELGEDRESIHPSLLQQHFAKEKEALLTAITARWWEHAIRQGLGDSTEGKYVKRRRRILAGGSAGGVITVLAVAFVLFNPWAPVEVHDALNQEGTLVVPDLSYMMETGEQSNLVQENIDSGDYIELGRVMETESGVRLILDAAMDLGKEKVFWYTLEKGRLHNLPFITRGEVMDASETEYLGDIQSVDTRIHTDNSFSKGLMSFAKRDDSLLKSTEEALMKFIVETQEEQHNRTFTLKTEYPELPEQSVQKVALHDSFTVEGQSFQLTELIMTPDYTQVKLKQDAENMYSTDSLDVSLHLNSESNSIGYGAMERGLDYYLFPPFYYEEFDHLQLWVRNELVKPDPVLVVNTERSKIVSSPVRDKRLPDHSSELSIDQSTMEEGYFTVQFPKWKGIDYRVSNQYEDAAGHSYFIQGSELGADGVTSLKLNDFDYAQPLTFHLTSYEDTLTISDTEPIVIPLIDDAKE